MKIWDRNMILSLLLVNDGTFHCIIYRIISCFLSHIASHISQFSVAFSPGPAKSIYSLLTIHKAVRFWSCPLSRSRGRTIPHLPCTCMPKWAQTCGKILSQVGLEPMITVLRGWCSTTWATTADDELGNNCGMSPKCGYAVYSHLNFALSASTITA